MISGNWKAVYKTASRIRPGSPREPWRVYLLAAATAFALSFGLRCLEIPFWENPEYKLGGEWLLATHDAYHWIAGAEGFEFGAGHPMSELIRILAALTGSLPANTGFWLPLFLGSLLSAGLACWGVVYRMPWAGMVAGVLAASAPGFLSRTLLGYCDTDLVIPLFGLILAFIPAAWLLPWLERPLDWLLRNTRATFEGLRGKGWPGLWRSMTCDLKDRLLAFQASRRASDRQCAERPGRHGRAEFAAVNTIPERTASLRRLILARSLSPLWLVVLLLGGLFGHWTQEWHSYFPYAVRFTAALVPILILTLGPYGGRRLLLTGALVFCLPLLGGGLGGMVALAVALVCQRLRERRIGGHYRLPWPGQAVWLADEMSAHVEMAGDAPDGWRKLLPWLVPLLWLAVFILLADGEVWARMLRSVSSYVKTGADAGHSRVLADPVVFPSVSQSIIEVQNLRFSQMLRYFHPISPIALAGFLGCVALFFLLPGTCFLGVMFAIAISSLKLGGRMAMFTAPVFALGLCLGGRIFILWLFSERRRFARKIDVLRPLFLRLQTLPARILAGSAVALILLGPVAGEIPYLSNGPILSRDQAAALSFLKDVSPEDSVVWNWWDYGYATHHFSRRRTVSDGARHGGPSLFVPAAVFATDDPYFAGQLMAYTSQAGGSPGDVFRGLTGGEAASLMADLDSGKLAPVARSKQYLVVSFELIPLGYWISTYGTWDFTEKRSEGYFISSINQSLQYNLETGVVLVRGFPPAYAASIDAFERDGVQHQAYFRQEPGAMHFLFNSVTGEAYSVKSDFYEMLLCQLLVSAPDDSRFAPHFSLVYANPTVRVYELLQDRPAPEEGADPPASAAAGTPGAPAGGSASANATLFGIGDTPINSNGSAVGLAEPEPVRDALVEEAVRQGLVNATDELTLHNASARHNATDGSGRSAGGPDAAGLTSAETHSGRAGTDGTLQGPHGLPGHDPDSAVAGNESASNATASSPAAQ